MLLNARSTISASVQVPIIPVRHVFVFFSASLVIGLYYDCKPKPVSQFCQTVIHLLWNEYDSM